MNKVNHLTLIVRVKFMDKSEKKRLEYEKYEANPYPTPRVSAAKVMSRENISDWQNVASNLRVKSDAGYRLLGRMYSWGRDGSLAFFNSTPSSMTVLLDAGMARRRSPVMFYITTIGRRLYEIEYYRREWERSLAGRKRPTQTPQDLERKRLEAEAAKGHRQYNTRRRRRDYFSQYDEEG